MLVAHVVHVQLATDRSNVEKDKKKDSRTRKSALTKVQRDTITHGWPRLNTDTHWRVPCWMDTANAGRPGDCSVNGRPATVSDD